MRVNPQIGNALKRYEQDVIWKKAKQEVIGYLPQIEYEEKTAKIVIQNPRPEELQNFETDYSLKYIKAIAREDIPLKVTDVIEYRGVEYKVISVQDWKDHGFYRAIAEEFQKNVMTLDKFQRAVCDYVANLLEYDEKMVVFGRRNYYRTEKIGQYIVIDETNTNIEGRVRSFDDEGEVLHQGAIISNEYSISFYGEGAKKKLFDFINLQKTQKGYDLQRKLGLGVGVATEPQNLAFMDGTQYRIWWQIKITCKYTQAIEMELLKIDKVSFKNNFDISD